jgi:hypothetical protein
MNIVIIYHCRNGEKLQSCKNQDQIGMIADPPGLGSFSAVPSFIYKKNFHQEPRK